VFRFTDPARLRRRHGLVLTVASAMRSSISAIAEAHRSVRQCAPVVEAMQQGTLSQFGRSSSDSHTRDRRPARHQPGPRSSGPAAAPAGRSSCRCSEESGPVRPCDSAREGASIVSALCSRSSSCRDARLRCWLHYSGESPASSGCSSLARHEDLPLALVERLSGCIFDVVCADGSTPLRLQWSLLGIGSAGLLLRGH